MAKFAVITYSTYGHVTALAQEIAKGVESEGAKAHVFRVPETLPQEVLEKLHAPEKPADIPVIKPEDLVEYDGYIFGFPTRFGNIPAQISAFFDSTGGLWATGGLYQKPVSFFVSTGSGGGKETTVRSTLSFVAHHGLIYIPLGYGKVFDKLTNVSAVHGSSPWGVGTIAGSDGSRSPTESELKTAYIQGSEFAKVASKLAAPATAKSEPVAEQPAAETTQEASDVKKTAETEVKNAPPPAKTEKSGCCVIV
ncbi:hypothetical protein OGAPHI_005514 [Ogataea philodendri]|uniref:Flavodoxin-like domain-containing protein n=1 Tax=Ogataea philodendri TaxID=1378263 RepID=A0A9P8NYW9_9ASCO|nr:uncharacterized protein OGAPHI_005514 [Ogataea philodendri]KAH3662265.1 hypothetical protein OGAPHI_005514 [Ogataea philodendri]